MHEKLILACAKSTNENFQYLYQVAEMQMIMKKSLQPHRLEQLHTVKRCWLVSLRKDRTIFLFVISCSRRQQRLGLCFASARIALGTSMDLNLEDLWLHLSGIQFLKAAGQWAVEMQSSRQIHHRVFKLRLRVRGHLNTTTGSNSPGILVPL